MVRRKSLEKQIKALGGTSKSPKARRLAIQFNEISAREKARKRGIGSLNPNDPIEGKVLRQLRKK